MKGHGVIGLPIYGFLLMFNSNIGPNYALLRDISFQKNLGDFDFDLSRSLKVKSSGAIGLPIYGFLLMCNSNIGPNRGLQNLGDLEFDLSIYGFLLVSNSNYMSKTCSLGVIV